MCGKVTSTERSLRGPIFFFFFLSAFQRELSNFRISFTFQLLARIIESVSFERSYSISLSAREISFGRNYRGDDRFEEYESKLVTCVER